MEVTNANKVLEESAALREAAVAPKALTIPEAISKGEFYRAQPSVLVDHAMSRQVIDALLSALQHSGCYFKAMKNGEEVFVLRQSDRAAPLAIINWAENALAHGCREEKHADAIRTAMRWQDQPVRQTRWPT